MALEHCPYCGFGRLHTTHRTIVRIYGDTLVHIPNVPTHKCDICGYIVFDEHALSRSEVLIGESGPPPNVHARSGDPVSPAKAGDSPDTLLDRPK